MEQQNAFLGKEELPVLPASSDEKTMALLSHALTFIASFVAPLIIYLVKKDESSFIAANAKESLNFQITMMIIFFILIITVIGIFLIWIVGLAALALVMVASIKASEGKLYKYPFAIRLIK